MNQIKWIAQYVKPYWLKEVIALIFLILSSALQIINPIIIGILVNRMIQGDATQHLMRYLFIMIAVTIARIITRYIYQNVFEKVGQNVLYDLRNDLYQKIHELDFNYFNHNRVGDLLARMTGDMDIIRHFVSWVAPSFLENVLWFILAVIVMFQIDVWLTLMMLAVTPFIYILTKKLSKESYPLFFDIRESFAKLNSTVEENIGGNRVVKAFAREGFEIEKFNDVNEAYMNKNLESVDVSAKYLPGLEFLSGFLSVLTLVFGGIFTIQGNMTIGSLVTFSNYLWMLNNPLRNSGWIVSDTQRFFASCVKIRQLLDEKVDIESTAIDTHEKIKGDVMFDHVSFAFPDDPDNLILEDISFSVKQGAVVGILGQTGSGKSTLVSLLARFYDATEGVIYLGGKSIQDWSVRQLRENISIVMQEPFLFSNTIIENIGFGLGDYKQDYVKQVAQVADAHQFIERMPDGYNTLVGERGVGLSGGQKQRISLARSLVMQPSILILDDTTSAVDMETEHKIQTGLKDIIKDSTTFTIAHRISSVKDADLILVLDDGKIIERGTHEELIAKEGQYYETYQKQVGHQ